MENYMLKNPEDEAFIEDFCSSISLIENQCTKSLQALAAGGSVSAPTVDSSAE